MSRAIWLLIGSAFAAVLAADVYGRDIKTLDGKTYIQARITRAEKDGIRIVHRDGVAFIKASSLSPALRDEFGLEDDVEAAGQTVTTSAAVAAGRKIETLDGTSYQDVVVTRATPRGIHIRNSSGETFLDFSRLSKSIRDEFGYSAEAYAASTRIRNETAVATPTPEAKQSLRVQFDPGPAWFQQRLKENSGLLRKPPEHAATINPVPRYRYYYAPGVYVRGYYTRDGRYVRPHVRSR